jgi:hypothetical protein
MGSSEGVSARTKLALTLKVEGGMWLRASPRPAPFVGAGRLDGGDWSPSNGRISN